MLLTVPANDLACVRLCARVQACLEAGFQDFATMRQDADLAALRGAELDKLLGRCARPAAVLLALDAAVSSALLQSVMWVAVLLVFAVAMCRVFQWVVINPRADDVHPAVAVQTYNSTGCPTRLVSHV